MEGMFILRRIPYGAKFHIVLWDHFSLNEAKRHNERPCSATRSHLGREHPIHRRDLIGEEV
jgi:hypothetical protein